MLLLQTRESLSFLVSVVLGEQKLILLRHKVFVAILLGCQISISQNVIKTLLLETRESSSFLISVVLGESKQ